MIVEERVLGHIAKAQTEDVSPFYIYDTQAIRKKCDDFSSIPYRNKSIHFATMANINPEFLAIVKDANLNVFVNSLKHLESVKEGGFKGPEIVFTSSAMSENVMKSVFDENVQVNLDSVGQLELWQKLFPEKAVGIRCNIGGMVKPYSTRAGFFLGKESRLGLTVDEIKGIANKHIIKGLHLYIGTDIFDIDYFIGCYRALIELSHDFPELEYLNFGGGFGVSEQGDEFFDIKTYGEKVSALMEEVSLKRGNSIQMILEPGRIIGGESGYFVCQVTDIKERENQVFVGVNASTAQFTRPLIYPESANHPVVIIRNGALLEAENQVNTTIYGCSTYSRDIFCKGKQLPRLSIGDLVIFANSGSYCASSYCEFLGFDKPKEVFI
ncbi:MAG: hypothetical protein K0M40_10040 [Prolixibacteraceae bacterium]|nr:hypothetical protein [Prolixibacteraceae bacterium]